MINLLPDEIKKRAQQEKYKKIGLVIMILLFVILIGSNNYIKDLATNYQLQLKDLNEQVRQLKTTKKVVSTQLQKKNKLQEQLTLVDNLRNDLNYKWLIKDLQLIIPPQVWLEKLNINQTDQLLLVGGKADNNQQLLETAKRLEKYPYFEGVKIDSSQQLDDHLYFTIRGRVRQGL
mgnify:FL=1